MYHQGDEPMRDLSVSKVRVPSSDGSGHPIASPGRVRNPEINLDLMTDRNSYWLTFASRFDWSRMTLISCSRPMNGSFTGNRVKFELRSEAKDASIAFQAIALAI
jgi:hypothetical protein